MKPRYVTVHCSATQPLNHIDAEWIRQVHLNRGFRDTGYHLIIKANADIEAGRPIDQTGAHVRGHNTDNIGICLVGGIGRSGKPEANFSWRQLDSLVATVRTLQVIYGIPDENVKGHRDWSPDLDGDGVIEQGEWLKSCPCFDVKTLLEKREFVFKGDDQ